MDTYLEINDAKCSKCGLCAFICCDVAKQYIIGDFDETSLKPFVFGDTYACHHCNLCLRHCPNFAIELARF